MAPDNVRTGYIAVAAWHNGEQYRLEEPGADVHEPVSIDSARHIGKPIPVVDVPEFLACFGIVGVRPEGAGTNHLGLSVDIDYERCRIRLITLSASRLPADLPRTGVERSHELVVKSIATDD